MKNIYYTQVIKGQPVLTKKTVPEDYQVKGTDLKPGNPSSDLVGQASAVVGEFTNLISAFRNNWQLLLIGGIATILLIKRL